MPLGATHTVPGLDDPEAIAHADADLLSLALIDARNVSLRWLALLEEARLETSVFTRAGGRRLPPLWLIGHAGWYQEWTIARQVQRSRGEAADPRGTRLASIHPQADPWFADGPELALRAVEQGDLDPAAVRSYLAATLESTLELLGSAEPSDAALYVYRAALLHEDRIGAALAEMALVEQWPARLSAMPSRVDREPVWLPAQTMLLGAARDGGGLVPENERWAHPVTVPAFEIDAQVVNWARFVPFAEDGGYDQRRFWSDGGWAWLQANPERRAPRHVEQMRGGVVLMRQGRLARAPAAQAVLHVTRHEAEAWCAWAGRRLPTEPEWELAARVATSRGFVWGDVCEWVAGSARPWPGHAPTPDGLDRLPASPAGHGVLRGASWLTRGRLKRVRGRRFVALADDGCAVGFRSCAP